MTTMDDYLDDFFSSTEELNPQYLTDGDVVLCDKSDVLQFGKALLPTFYYLNFLLSLVGNSLVLCIIYKYERLTTVTNVFLLNLVVSDLLFTSSLPFWAFYHSSEWIFGSGMCKLVGSLYSVGFSSSILFLTLMTFDRYLAVVHAVAAAQSRRRFYAWVSSIGVWALSLLASVKDVVLFNTRESEQYGWLCEESGFSSKTLEKWRLLGYYQQFGLFFLVPLTMVLYCYARIAARVASTRMREKCRAVKLIFVIVLAFFVCWTPYNVVILLAALRLSSSEGGDCADALDRAEYVTRNLAYLYCCISPVFYTFVGTKFQRHLRRLLARHVPCLKVAVLSTQSSRTTSNRSRVTEY